MLLTIARSYSTGFSSGEWNERSTFAVSTKERSPYQSYEERKYWGIYYLRKAGHFYDGIADIVEIVKSRIVKITRLDSLY